MSHRPIQLLPASRWPAWPVGTVLLIAAAAAASAAGLYWATERGEMFCLMKRLLHIPCPACGGTRAGLCLLHGDIAAAFAYNPLVVGVAAAVACLVVLRFALGRRVSIRLGRRGRVMACTAAAAAFVAHWVFLIATGK